MRKHQELTDPTSCMSRARDDEMTFVLLGRDRAAPEAVEAWINERIKIGKNKPDDPQILEAKEWVATVKAEQEAEAEERRQNHVAFMAMDENGGLLD